VAEARLIKTRDMALDSRTQQLEIMTVKLIATEYLVSLGSAKHAPTSFGRALFILH
jgi:hypothetical protein